MIYYFFVVPFHLPQTPSGYTCRSLRIQFPGDDGVLSSGGSPCTIAGIVIECIVGMGLIMRLLKGTDRDAS
jgi:hypothetical protein